MTAAHDVLPSKWTDVKVLIDDGSFSAIWGRYCGYKNCCLAVRWNGSGDKVGYPNQGKNPLWFNIPDYLAEGIIQDVRSKLFKSLVITSRQLDSPVRIAKNSLVERIKLETEYLANVEFAEGQYNKQKLESAD